MKGRIHFAAGIMTGIACGYAIYGWSDAMVSFAAMSTIFSVFPDIDTPDSAVGCLVPYISRPVYAAVGHRTVTHAPLAVALTGFVCYIICGKSFPPHVAGLLSGWCLHLLQDLFTRGGIKMLYPLSTTIRLSDAKTGSWRNIVATVFIVAVWVIGAAKYAGYSVPFLPF